MSSNIETAKSQVEQGKYKAAVNTLWLVERDVRVDDGAGAQEMMDVAASLLAHTKGATRAECEQLISLGRKAQRQAELDCFRRDALAIVKSCYVIGEAGLGIGADGQRAWDLVFRDDDVVLMDSHTRSDSNLVKLGWQGLRLDIEGAGAFRSGGGFMGGGFGLAGAAAGMLTASALNALTTRTGIETILHLQTPSAELFLYHGKVTPEALRRSLSPVFLRLRQNAVPDEPEQSESGDDHVVDRLHKLADLLDRGMISDEEFATLKAKLLS